MKQITSDKGVNFIKHREGFEPTPKPDPIGILTVGYGHVCQAWEDWHTALTEAKGVDLLMKDLVWREHVVMDFVKVPLTQAQFDALVSFVFNEGVEAFKDSTLLRFLNAGSYAAAAIQFARWTIAGGRCLKGLVARRLAERTMFEKGIYPDEK